MKYQTEPLETYRWAKEYRARLFHEASRATEDGKLLIMGNMNFPKEICTGLGDFRFMAGEAYAVSVIREGGADLAQAAAEEVEGRGVARDLCGYTRYFWGSMFLNRNPWGGAFPSHPAFITSFMNCASQGKWFQVVSEHLGVPHLCLDAGFQEENQGLHYQQHCMDYLKQQYLDLIEQMEKITGQKYNWDLFVEGVANCYRCRGYLAEVLKLNATVPSPLEQKLWLPFLMIDEWVPYRAETVSILKALHDEVKSRVERGIAANINEGVRVTHEGMSPWHSLYIFTYLRQRGLAVIGWGSNPFFRCSPVFQRNADGSISPDNPVMWDKIPHSKSEALNIAAYQRFSRDKILLSPREQGRSLTSLLRFLKARGAIFALDRGCEHVSACILGVKRALQEEGLATMLYEYNRVDALEWSWPHVQDALDTFLEALGVSALA